MRKKHLTEKTLTKYSQHSHKTGKWYMEILLPVFNDKIIEQNLCQLFMPYPTSSNGLCAKTICGKNPDLRKLTRNECVGCDECGDFEPK